MLCFLFPIILQQLLFLIGSQCLNENVSFIGGGGVCDLNAVLENKCAIVVPRARSRIECALPCEGDSSCIGFSVDGHQGRCFHHFECPHTTTSLCPDNKSRQHSRFYSKTCDNGGEWRNNSNAPLNKLCQCKNGWVGRWCQARPKTCDDLISFGYPDGRHIVLLEVQAKDAQGKALPVACDIKRKNGYSHIVVMRNDGAVDFNRSWNEYRDGFRHDNNDKYMVWIGLETWHVIADIGYTNLMVMVIIEGLGKMFRQYRSFRVGDETLGYHFDVGVRGKEFNTGDILSKYGYGLGDCFDDRYQGYTFTTWDTPRDGGAQGYYKNCASLSGHGWWWSRDCLSTTPCNLMGWGTQFLNDREPNQLMRFEKFDIEKEKSRNVRVLMYVTLDVGRK